MRDGEAYRRMDAARRAEEFGRTRDRVGVAFARCGCCPPTLDEDALCAFLRVLDTVPRGSEFDATAIGVVLAKAVDVLPESDAKSKVVILLSDKENNVEEILPEEAAALAKDAGVRVHHRPEARPAVGVRLRAAGLRRAQADRRQDRRRVLRGAHRRRSRGLYEYRRVGDQRAPGSALRPSIALSCR